MYRGSRREVSQQSEQHSDVEGGSDDNSKEDKQERDITVSSSSRTVRNVVALLLIPLGVVVVVALLSMRGLSSGKLTLVAVATIPFLLAASVAAGAWKARAHQRLIALAFVGAILCNQLPNFLSAALASTALVVFSLSTRPVDTVKEPPDVTVSRRKEQLYAVCASLCLVLVLLTDNFFVWVVAATYYPSHSGLPKPLQDNGRLVQQYWFEQVLHLSRRDVQQLRATVNIEWALVAGLGAAFIVCELQWLPKRSLYRLATHTIITLASARFIRVVSFLLTVLPSQMPDCYRHHFPNPPPQDWTAWLQVGLLPNASGGCNDLIVSGHATVTSVLACVSASVAGHWAFSVAIWSMLAMDFMVEVYEGFHYSVDMWMGALFTVMLWRILAPMEATDCATYKREFYPLTDTRLQDVLLYTLPALLAYLSLTTLPQSLANYLVLSYFVVSIGLIHQCGINHYVQHLLLCMLYIALGTYL